MTENGARLPLSLFLSSLIIISTGVSQKELNTGGGGGGDQIFRKMYSVFVNHVAK